MSAINKQFGVINIDSKYYFGSGGTSGKIYPSVNMNNILICIGDDYYQFVWSDLIISGVAPSDFNDAINLLQQLFS